LPCGYPPDFSECSSYLHGWWYLKVCLICDTRKGTTTTPVTSKLKLSHYTPRRRLGERRYSSYSFSTSALDRGGWSAPRFSHGERIPGTHCTGGWVGRRAGLDREVKRKNPFASAGDRTSISLSSSPQPDTTLTELPGSQI
jgi:hypothetical protein